MLRTVWPRLQRERPSGTPPSPSPGALLSQKFLRSIRILRANMSLAGLLLKYKSPAGMGGAEERRPGVLEPSPSPRETRAGVQGPTEEGPWKVAQRQGEQSPVSGPCFSGSASPLCAWKRTASSAPPSAQCQVHIFFKYHLSCHIYNLKTDNSVSRSLLRKAFLLVPREM